MGGIDAGAEVTAARTRSKGQDTQLGSAEAVVLLDTIPRVAGATTEVTLSEMGVDMISSPLTNT